MLCRHAEPPGSPSDLPARFQRLRDRGQFLLGIFHVGQTDRAQVVERVEAVVTGDGEEAGGAEALVHGVGEGVADPVQVGVSGAVVEGEHEDDVSAADFLVGAEAGLILRRRC